MKRWKITVQDGHGNRVEVYEDAANAIEAIGAVHAKYNHVDPAATIVMVVQMGDDSGDISPDEQAMKDVEIGQFVVPDNWAPGKVITPPLERPVTDPYAEAQRRYLNDGGSTRDVIGMTEVQLNSERAFLLKKVERGTATVYDTRRIREVDAGLEDFNHAKNLRHRADFVPAPDVPVR